MKSKIILSGLAALALSALPASACKVFVVISCPGVQGSAGANVSVCLAGSAEGCQYTDSLGTALFTVPSTGTYQLCVNKKSLGPGLNLSPACVQVNVLTEDTTEVDLFLSGKGCTPVSGGCWQTGGGTIDLGLGNNGPTFSYGGVVYPGCSPKAAEGGNWNVVDHADGLHFQGQQIVVDGCFGVPTASPKVTVNIIDYHGTGMLSGIGGNAAATIPVYFVGQAIDNHDGGAGSDQLYLLVTDGPNGTGNVLMRQIGSGIPALDNGGNLVQPLSGITPQTVTTGNLQIHQSSCGK